MVLPRGYDPLSQAWKACNLTNLSMGANIKWRRAEVSIPTPSLVPTVFKTVLAAVQVNPPYGATNGTWTRNSQIGNLELYHWAIAAYKACTVYNKSLEDNRVTWRCITVSWMTSPHTGFPLLTLLLGQCPVSRLSPLPRHWLRMPLRYYYQCIQKEKSHNLLFISKR